MRRYFDLEIKGQQKKLHRWNRAFFLPERERCRRRRRRPSVVDPLWYRDCTHTCGAIWHRHYSAVLAPPGDLGWLFRDFSGSFHRLIDSVHHVGDGFINMPTTSVSSITMTTITTTTILHLLLLPTWLTQPSCSPREVFLLARSSSQPHEAAQTKQ